MTSHNGFMDPSPNFFCPRPHSRAWSFHTKLAGSLQAYSPLSSHITRPVTTFVSCSPSLSSFLLSILSLVLLFQVFQGQVVTFHFFIYYCHDLTQPIMIWIELTP